MLDILETHLKTACSPEMTDAVTQACELFEDYELPGYQDAYTDLLLTSDNLDVGDLNTALTQLTVDMQLQVLQQMLIVIEEEITMQQGNMLLKALRQVESTEFNNVVISLCSEPDTDEVLCEILSIVSGEPVENFYNLITNIDQCVLDRIKMVCQQNNTEDTVSPIDIRHTREVVDRLIQYKNFIGNKPLFVYDYILDGEPIELPLEVYYDDMWNDIASLNPQEKAIQLFAATLVSSDSNSEPKSFISKMLNKTYTSVDDVTPIINALENIILKFHAK